MAGVIKGSSKSVGVDDFLHTFWSRKKYDAAGTVGLMFNKEYHSSLLLTSSDIEGTEGWLGLHAIVIKNEDGTNTTVRYGEIEPTVKVGTVVRQGQQIGIIRNNSVNQDHMLHIEVYWGTSSGNLTDHSNPKYKYVPQRNYVRRSDLMDPTFIRDLPHVY